MPMIPCHCPRCNGHLRDRRTVRSHFRTYGSSISDRQVPCHTSQSLSADLGSTIVHVSDSYAEQATNICCMTVDADNLSENGSLASGNAQFDNGDEPDDGDSTSGGDGSGDEDNGEEIDEQIKKCILRILKSKVKYGWSQEETLSQLRSLYELTNDNDIPHQTWQAVLMFLRELGYKSPRLYKICCSADHVILVEDDQCPICQKERETCTDYFVLGLNLESIFLSEDKIKKHLAHWEDKDEWLNKNVINVPYKELWHGARFRELSYFWDDTKETALSTRCPDCDHVISTDEMAEAAGSNDINANVVVHLSCSECGYAFDHTVKTMRGSPINQAFIFHEDGFNAFLRKSRGIASIHISHACTRKEQRLKGDNLYVYSFVPTFLIKEGVTHKMDAFLRPLIDDIGKLYTEGVDVDVKAAIEVNNYALPMGKHKVRSLLLLGTADLKAHQEIILYAGGK